MSRAVYDDLIATRADIRLCALDLADAKVIFYRGLRGCFDTRALRRMSICFNKDRACLRHLSRCLTTRPPQLLAVRVNEDQWIVSRVGVHIPLLRVEQPLVTQDLAIRAREPALCRVEVPRSEVVEAGVRVPFLGGPINVLLIAPLPNLVLVFGRE